MAYYKLIREKSSSPASNDNSKVVRGTLYSVEHRYSGSAGEYKEYLTPICPTLENADYLIPALIYKVQVTQSRQISVRSLYRIVSGETHPKHT